MQNHIEDKSKTRAKNHFHGNYKNPDLPYEDGIKSVTHISKLLTFALILFLPLAALQTAVDVYLVIDLQGYIALLQNPSPSNAWIHNAIFGISIAYRLSYIVCIVLSSWFLFRAARNLNTVAPGELGTSPHFAWLWFFIPFANFYKPYQTVTAIDRVTRQTAGLGSTANKSILTWWVFFISSVFIGATNITLPIGNLFQIMLIADVVSGVLAIVAAVFFIRVTRELASHQKLLKSSGVAHVFD